MADKEADPETPTIMENKDRSSRTEGDDSSVLELRGTETVVPGTSLTDDTSRLVTQSVSAADAELSSSSSGIEAGSSTRDAAEISSSTDAEQEISSAGQETAASSPDTGGQSAPSSVPEVTRANQQISPAGQEIATPDSGTSFGASPDFDIQSESSSGVDVRPDSSPTDAGCEISSAGQGTSESSPDTGPQSVISSAPEIQSGSSPDVAQPESSSDDAVQSEPSYSGHEMKAESSPDDGQSELSTDTGVHSETSSTFEIQPESFTTDAAHQIVSAEASPDIDAQDQLSTVSDVKPDAFRIVTAEGTILSSMDVVQTIHSTKETQAQMSSVSGVVIPPSNDNSLLRALLNKDRSPEADPAPQSDLPTEFTEAEAEEMLAFGGNRCQRNMSFETSRPFPVVPRSTSFEEAASEVIVYPEEGDHVVPDVGRSWERTPLGSYNPCAYDETTSDSLVSEQYTASESYSPEVQSTEESAAEENQELLVVESVATAADTSADTERTVQDPGVSTVTTVHVSIVATVRDADVATVPTLQESGVATVPTISNPDATVPTVQTASIGTVSTMEESSIITLPMAKETATMPKISNEADAVSTISNPDATVPTVQTASIGTVSKVEESSNTTLPMAKQTASVQKISNEDDAVPTISNEAGTGSPIRRSAASPEDACKVKATKRPMPRSDDVSSGSEDSDLPSPAKKMAEGLQMAYAPSTQVPTTSVPTVPVTETDSEETPDRGKGSKRPIEQPEAGSSGSQGPGFPSPTKKRMESPSHDVSKTPEKEN